MAGQILHSPTLYNPRMLGVGNWRLFDAVVAPTRDEGDYTHLNHAIDAGAKSIFVKEGTYDAGDVTFTMDVAGLYICGAGYGTYIHNTGTSANLATISANNCVLANMRLAGDGGGATGGTDCISVTGTGVRLLNLWIGDADDDAIVVGGAECLIAGCTLEDADDVGILVSAARCRIIGNYIQSVVATGISIDGNGDNFLVSGNHIESATASITIAAGGDNGIADGNIADIAISDSGTGNTIGDNEIY